MPVDPYFTERLRLALDSLPAADRDPAGPAVRERVQELSRNQPAWESPDVAVEGASVPGPHGPVPVRTYRPVRGDATGALLWAHGGGFRHGDLDMPEAHRVSGEIARRTGAFVVSVGYRLAGDGVRYPVPLDDVHAAWSWLCGDGLPPGSGPVAIGGASAGAALALATALRSRDGGERVPDALLLAYPFAHFPVPALDEATTDELRAKAPHWRFTPAGIEDMVRNYVGRLHDVPALALPGAARLDGLPPTHLALSEYDDLRPSGELLERQLREAGVPVASHVARGMLHGHLNQVADLAAIEESLAFLAGALQRTTARA